MTSTGYAQRCPACFSAPAAYAWSAATPAAPSSALGATEVSNSWDGEESEGETSYDSYFHHPGVPITVSAGDDGYGVSYPAASQYVISVGGTALKRASNSRGWEETVWSGTGSGCSAYEPKPVWQHDSGCSRRTDNDVSAVASTTTPVSVADSYEVPAGYEYEPGWALVAGTSVSSPLVAGVMGLSDEVARDLGADAFYQQGQENGLNDVVSGSNGSCGTYLCNAESGYSGPAGVGTPDGVSTPRDASIASSTAAV